jgi:protein tyrosine/serine phosphatase
MFRKSRISLVFVFAALFSAIVGGWAYQQHQRYKHFAVHEEGMVYRSAWLHPDVFSELIERHQIRAVVNLCKPGEMGESRWDAQRSAVTNAGAKLIELEMPTSIDATDPEVARHLETMKNPDNYPMLVHCQHGVTRTAKFLSIYDIVFRDMSGSESLSRQPLFGREDHNVNVRAFVKLFERSYRDLYPTAKAEDLRVLRQ